MDGIDVLEYLVGGFKHVFIFHFIFGMSSFPLTNSIIFQRGFDQPPTSHFFVGEMTFLILKPCLLVKHHNFSWWNRNISIHSSWFPSLETRTRPWPRPNDAAAAKFLQAMGFLWRDGGSGDYSGFRHKNGDFHAWVWVKIRYPNNWMVNTKLD